MFMKVNGIDASLCRLAAKENRAFVPLSPNLGGKVKTD
jgi:hypothetical protein